MNNNKAMLLIGGGTIGIIGALLLPSFPFVGVPIILVAIIMVVMTKIQTKPKHEISHEMKIETPKQKHQEMMDFLREEPAFDKHIMTLLQAERRKANLPSRQPVLLDGENRPALTVYDVLIEVINIAQAYKLPPEELAKDITKIYPRIFDNVEGAILQYPSDLDLLTYWLAHRALVDVRTELVTNPKDVRKSMANRT